MFLLRNKTYQGHYLTNYTSILLIKKRAYYLAICKTSNVANRQAGRRMLSSSSLIKGLKIMTNIFTMFTLGRYIKK